MRTERPTETAPDDPPSAGTGRFGSFFGSVTASVNGWLSDRLWHGRARGRTRGQARRSTQLWHAAVLVAVCLAVYLPGLFTIPPIDRDESRFAQASRQMFESVAFDEETKAAAPLDLYSGGLAVPYVIEKPRLNKPPLIYWLQVGSAWLFTGGDPLQDHIWMYRVPSVLSAIAAVLFTWRIGLLLFDARAALLGAVLLAICPLVVFDAHQARADQLLLACTTGAMWALAGIIKNTERVSRGMSGGASRSRRVFNQLRLASGLAIAVALGVLAKGPITPMIAALTISAYVIIKARPRLLLATHPWLAVIVTLATIGPWVYFVAQHFGFEEYKALVFDETVGRSASAKEGHWGPPGYHALLLPVLFFPGSLGLAFANIHMWTRCKWDWSRWKRGGWGAWRGSWQLAFLAAWLFPSWIVFELVSTKLPHYTMPMYPAGALLCARALLAPRTELVRRASRVLKWLELAWSVIPLAMLALALTVPDVTYAIAFLVILFIPAYFRHHWGQSRSQQLLARLRSESMTWFLALLCLLFRVGAFNNLSPRVVARLQDEGLNRQPVILGNYQEDSLVYLLRGRATRVGSDAAYTSIATPGAFFVVEADSPGAYYVEEFGEIVEGNSISKGIDHTVIVGRVPEASP